jgi:hypothetical protein
LAGLAASAQSQSVDSSTLLGKVLFGYQGWFRTPGDGSNAGWSHWSRGAPSPATMAVDLYPDLSEFDPTDLFPIPNETVGSKPAFLFSAYNPRVVLKHFEWMKAYGLDGVLLQRFLSDIPRDRAEHEGVLRNVIAAAEKTGRVFAIEYDISGAPDDTFAQSLKDDWQYLVSELHVTESPRYLHHNGRPVVSIWGMGLNDSKHPPSSASAAIDICHWFERVADVTLIGGTPAYWRERSRDSKQDPSWAKAYAAMKVIQPWTVGRYGDLKAVDDWKANELVPDLAATKSAGQLYMPVIFPGFSWHNLNPNSPENQIPRLGGQFLWRQAANARSAGAQMLKIAMFDEVNEGTAVFKAAPKQIDAPDQGYWLTLDADGANLPSDYYLKLAGLITQAFHRNAALPLQLPRP